MLYTPLTNRELILAKVLGSVIPSVLLTWIAFVVYTAIVGVLGAPLMGGLFFPTWTWAVLIVLLVPLVVGQATGLMLFDVTVALIAAAVLVVVDLLAFVLVVARFRRERIITSL